ncbi:MAG: hypothetical protein ACPGWR_15645 [Ardenticatenaceae bacterium]
MIPEHIKVKFFVEEPAAVDLPAFIPLFHGWIQNKTVEGLLIDVADYKHVPEGPGILLIGHEGDYAIDMANGRPGLLYSRKREWGDDHTLKQRLRTVFRLALRACQPIEAEPAFEGRIKFRTDDVELTFADRLNAPNQPETLDAVREEILAVLANLYPEREITLERTNQHPRQPFTLRIQASDAPNLSTLLVNV